MTDNTIIKISQTDNTKIVLGNEYAKFSEKLINLNQNQKSKLQDSTTAILKKINYQFQNGNNKPTGLMLGYVQSGKTLSFTALTAMARDNGFGIVILLAGSSLILQEQSIKRLKNDLGMDDQRNWFVEKTPDISDAQNFKNQLDSWIDDSIDDLFKQTILIPLLKHHGHLDNLVQLFSHLNIRKYGISALIIDDESDQISPNANARNDEIQEATITHRKILDLQECFDKSAYIQYTATPQANLLAEKTSMLSPDFSHLLEPGDSYTGGAIFFDPKNKLVKIVDSIEVDSETQRDESLDEALMYYLIGLADAYSKAIKSKSQPFGNRTMLVHPSHLTRKHDSYNTQINITLNLWKHTFEESEEGSVMDLFLNTYIELQKNYSDLDGIDDIKKNIKLAIMRLRVSIINAENDTNIDWGSSYGRIIIGGKAVDRGFTVEGLTVTHMARSVRNNAYNADTLQQRSRFCGYRAEYLSLCKIYMDQKTYDAFSDYVYHEQDLRKQLASFNEIGRSIKDWSRMFLLAQNMRPTRAGVHRGEIANILSGARWHFFGTSALVVPEFAKSNLEFLDNILKKIVLDEDKKNSGDTDVTRHKIAKLNSSQWVCDLLSQFQFHQDELSDGDKKIIIDILKNYQELSVHLMSFDAKRERTIDLAKNARTWLFQGRSGVYDGDASVKNEKILSVQIHKIHIKEIEGMVIPIIAIWVPKSKLYTGVHQADE